MESEKNDLLEVWSVFYIRRGKYYLTKLNGRLQIQESEILNYSNEKVMKFTKDKAIEIAKYNKTFNIIYGIVNHVGKQEIV